MGNSELAMKYCQNIKAKNKLNLIFEQTLRGKNMTRNLVAFAKDQTPKQEFFSVDEKMWFVINLLKKDLEGIHVICEYTPGIPELLADPDMIEHAVVNLVQNSIHALSLTRDPKIIIRTGHQEDHIVIEIEDTTVCVDADLVLTTDWYPATRYDTDSEAELNCDVNRSFPRPSRGYIFHAGLSVPKIGSDSLPEPSSFRSQPQTPYSLLLNRLEQ